MDRSQLTPDMIELGASLLRTLDSSRIPVTAAFWFLMPDKSWRYLIASPLFNPLKPEDFYRSTQPVVSKALSANTTLISSLSVMPPDHPLVQLLKAAIVTGQDSISGIRFTANTINGQFIEDAYIYRLS
jgi:hypothetical protein